MKNRIMLGLGVVLILAALYLAAGTASQDVVERPEVALRLATALHETPAPPPPTRTPTSIPRPTITPIPGWTRFTTLPLGDLLPATELWLPANFVGGDMLQDRERTLARLGVVGQMLPSMSVATRNESTGYLQAGYASGMTVFFAADSTTDYASAAKVRLVNLSRFNTQPALFVVDDYFSELRLLEGPAPDVASRYLTSRSDIVGTVYAGNYMGTPVWGGLIRKLEYHIQAGDSSWIMVFTCKESEFETKVDIFFQSVESFSILPSP